MFGENGQVAYSIGSLMNITAHMKDFHSPILDVQGPNAEIYKSTVRNLGEYHAMLTSREIEVLFQVGKGLTSQKMADIFNISVHTVRQHRKNIIKKLRASNSVDAYNKAVSMGLLIF